MQEEILKVVPRYNKKSPGRARVRYQAIAMVGDKDGTYGIGEKFDSSHQIAECSAMGVALARRKKIERGCWSLCNFNTVPFGVRGKHGGVMVSIRPAPFGVGINRPPLAKKILILEGIQDCLLAVKGDPKNHINLCKAIDDALCKLDIQLFHSR